MLLEKSNKKQDKQAKKSLDKLKDVASVGMELSSDEDERDERKLKEQNDAVIEEVLSLNGSVKKTIDLLDVPIAAVNLENELENLNIEELQKNIVKMDSGTKRQSHQPQKSNMLN